MSYEQPPPPPGGEPPYGGQPPYGGYPYGDPQFGGPPPQDPGRTMGIVGLVLAIFGGLCCGPAGLAGLIVSVIAYNKSKAAGYKNNVAMAGIIVGGVMIVIGTLLFFFYSLPQIRQFS